MRAGPGREAGVFLRGAVDTSNRYDLHPQGRRTAPAAAPRRRAPTVLASAPASVDRWAFARLTLVATSGGPVSLTALVDGVPRLAATDASASAHGGAGLAGLWTYTADVRFDGFVLRTP